MNEEYEKILNTQFKSMSEDTLTIREYLHKLLWTLWKEGAHFNSKRPFGDSGWEFDLYKGLITYSDEYGSLCGEEEFVEEVDEGVCNTKIFELIDYLFSEQKTGQLYLDLQG